MRHRTFAVAIVAVLMSVPAPVAAHGDATEILRPVEFSGRIVPVDEIAPESSEIIDDVATYRGGAWTARTEEMSDPRLDGTVTIEANRDLYLGAFGLQLSQASIRIETEDGAWQEAPGLVVDFGDQRPSTRTSAFIGEGANAGLITVAQVTLDPATGTLELEGVILEGGLPPEPDGARAAPSS